ncbi:MAG: hypothetical protein EXR96_09690 [Nitrospiraceae bacterium]|nr:hypothetical protein [Nitrospiraceae bacterium]
MKIFSERRPARHVPEANRVSRALKSPLAREACFSAVLLLVCLYLAGLLHDRPLGMGDPLFTFDAFSSFHQRLMQGEFPQWNPYSLWGRPATQWFVVPVSLLLSPMFFLFDHTPRLFYKVNVIATGLTYFSIYLTGRVLGYGRAISFVPLALISVGGFSYYASFFQNASFHVFFFLLVAALLRMHNQGMRVGAPGFAVLFALGASVALGLKLEGFVYGGAFMGLMFVFTALNPPHADKGVLVSWSSYVARVAAAFGAILLGMTATAWQFPLLAASLRMSERVSIEGSAPGSLLSLTLLKWAFLGLLLSPSLLLVAVNGLTVLVGRALAARYMLRPFSMVMLCAFAVFQLAAYFLIPRILEPVTANITKIGMTIGLGHEVTYSDPIAVLGAIVAVAFWALYVALTRKGSLTLDEVSKAALAFFAGWYVSGYSWTPWPFHSQEFYWFTHPCLALLMGLGALRLVEQGRGWLVGVLVCFHLMGEVGCLLSSAGGGFTWLAVRAFVLEIPIQILLVLESVLALVEIARRAFTALSEAWLGRIEWLFGAIGAIGFFLYAPGIIVTDSAGRFFRTVKTPYVTSEFTYRLKRRTNSPAFAAAYELTTAALRRPPESGGQMFRVPVRKVIDVGNNRNIHFLPAMAGVLNTVAGYASEVSRLNRLVVYGPQDETLRIPMAWHLEQPPLVYAYIRHGLGKKLTIDGYYKQYNEQVTLEGWSARSVASRLLAEEGAGVPRAFAVGNVRIFASEVEEYRWLEALSKSNATPWSVGTTSDPSFGPRNAEASSAAFGGKVSFVSDRPEEVTLEYVGAEAGYVVLLDQWAKGWQAYVDGAVQPIYRGFLTTRFVNVGPGKHTVTFKYATPYLALGVAVSLLSLVGAGAAIWFLARRRIPRQADQALR